MPLSKRGTEVDVRTTYRCVESDFPISKVERKGERMMHKLFYMGAPVALAVAIVWLGSGSNTYADESAMIPLHGTLTNLDGSPVDGEVTMTFRLYESASADQALYVEEQAVLVENGAFTVYLGSGAAPLDRELLDADHLHVGITVGTDEEITPRFVLGAVPSAASAAGVSENIPAGAVMLFDLPECPGGWSELMQARGRALVGLPDHGLVKGTVGTALEDLEDRAHGHPMERPMVTSSVSGGHEHRVASSSIDTSSSSVPHSHENNPPKTRTASTALSYKWSEYYDPGRDWYSYNHLGTLVRIDDWIDGFGNQGTGNSPISRTIGTPSVNYYTERQSHAHQVDIPAFTSGVSTDTTHTHRVELPAATTDTSGAHSHVLDMRAASVGDARTSEVMPYIQLLVCRKEGSVP